MVDSQGLKYKKGGAMYNGCSAGFLVLRLIEGISRLLHDMGGCLLVPTASRFLVRTACNRISMGGGATIFHEDVVELFQGLALGLRVEDCSAD